VPPEIAVGAMDLPRTTVNFYEKFHQYLIMPNGEMLFYCSYVSTEAK
jgi:hypothetical protein